MEYSISICIPTYNGAKYLQEALNSVKAQTYQDFEVVISDDASKDSTLEIVEAFKAQVSFPVNVFHHNPKGIGANWNNCITHAKGKYIKFLFQDDVLQPNCLQKLIDVIENNDTIGLVASKRQFINETPNDENIETWIENYGNLQQQFEDTTNALTLIDETLFKRADFYESPLNKIGEPST